MSPARRILIVRPSALGDVARTTPTLVSLRRAFPDAQIEWFVAEAFADAVRHHPMLDGVVPFDRDGMTPSRFVRLARQLRRKRYDRVYDLQGLARSGLFTWLTRAPRRVGFADARELGWLGCNVRYRLEEATRHTVDRMLGLLAADGVEPVHDLRLYLGPDDERWLTRFIDDYGLADGYTCLAPTAKWRCKCWPIEHYAEIARRLPGRIVVLAAPHEAEQVRPLLDAANDRAFFPRTTVGQLMAILSQTRLLVCNDSAPLHIAVGFDRPVVSVFGPTNPDRVGPYGREDTVIQPSAARAAGFAFDYRAHRDDQSLIAQISVEDVWKKVETILAL